MGMLSIQLKNSKIFAQFKAISQNLMHSNVSITDDIYGMLSDSDRKEVLFKITEFNKIQTNDSNEKLDQLIGFVKELLSK